MRKVIVSLAVCVSLWAVSSFVRAEDTSLNFTGAMNQMNALFISKNNQVVSVKWMIQTYCDVVFASSWFTQDGFVYSARQSSFVYLLCQNVDRSAPSRSIQLGDGSSIKANIIKTILSDPSFQDTHMLAWENNKMDFCSPRTPMNQCNVAKQVAKLFNMIINDYVNLKQPNLYGYTPWEDPETAANIFSATYFNGLKICSTDTERVYPDTCKTLKKYMKDAEKTIADVKTFKASELTKKPSAGVCDPFSPVYNLLNCWLYGDTQNSLQQFLNLSYNELFYYRLFAQYYTWMLATNAKVMLKIPVKEVSAEVFTRTKNMNNELIRSQWALSLSLRMLREFYTSFPLHIGFLMYHEDIMNLARPLGTLYTPLSQFYSTFQHVQKKD